MSQQVWDRFGQSMRQKGLIKKSNDGMQKDHEAIQAFKKEVFRLFADLGEYSPTSSTDFIRTKEYQYLLNLLSNLNPIAHMASDYAYSAQEAKDLASRRHDKWNELLESLKESVSEVKHVINYADEGATEEWTQEELNKDTVELKQYYNNMLEKLREFHSKLDITEHDFPWR